MKNWRIKLEYQNRAVDIVIEAKTYSEAYINSSEKYPGCVIKSISEIRKSKS